VDKYAAYQILADNWSGIMGDVEIIQTEGFGACNVVEAKTKMVKDKNGVEQEVEDGLKGRIIPFDLVQKTLFQSDLDAIAALQSRVEAIDGELDAARDELLGMEDTDKYFDAEKDNAFISKEITADSKPKADIEDDVKAQLKTIVALWDEKKAKNAQIKKNLVALEKKTIKTIEELDMRGINQFLELKWILPITSAIEALPDAVIQKLADSITDLSEKYAVTYNDIETGIVESEQNLATLIGQLTGDEFAIKGLSNLIKK
jgi:type I restriction enzyme M protein